MEAQNILEIFVDDIWVEAQFLQRRTAARTVATKGQTCDASK
jgi:hypothetical protein